MGHILYILLLLPAFMAPAYPHNIGSLLPIRNAPAAHEYYISVTEINYNTTEQSIEISTRIFIDDLEEALQRKGADSLFIGTRMERSYADSLISDYLLQKLILKSENSTLKFNYLGKEISEDLSAIWCFMELPLATSIKHLTVRNEVLMEVFDDQTNLIEIQENQKRKGYYILSSEDPVTHHLF